MSVTEIIKEVPHLSLAEMKEVALALQEAFEDAEDLMAAKAALGDPETISWKSLREELDALFHRS